MALNGKTIIVTRAATQAQELHSELNRLGARVIECPMIEIVPPADWAPVDRAIQGLDTYQWIILTSSNAVDHFATRLRLAVRTCSIPIAVVGPSTEARLEKWDLHATMAPSQFRAEGLLKLFPANLEGIRILFPRAEEGRDLLPEELRKRGAIVDIVSVYRTLKTGADKLAKLFSSENVDCIVFASPSAIPRELAPVLRNAAVAVIGPVTREAALAAGLKPSIEPQRSTVQDLAAAIAAYYAD
jgi:uroporphyrinogen III methyltransferase/synthase